MFVSSLRDAFLEWKVVFYGDFWVSQKVQYGHNNHARVSVDMCHVVKPVLWVRFSVNKGLGYAGRITSIDQGQFLVSMAPVGAAVPFRVPVLPSRGRSPGEIGHFPSLPEAWLCLWREMFFSCITVTTCNSENRWSSPVYSWLLNYEYFQSTFFIFQFSLGIYFQWLQAE